MAGVKGRSGGHNKKTDAEKIKLGTSRRGRLNQDAPDLVVGNLIVYDDDIGDFGKHLRDTYMPMLINNGTLGVTDSLAFHRFCRVAEDWFRYDKMCREKGRLAPSFDKEGNQMGVEVGAWSKVFDSLDKQLSDCIRMLGLSPNTRDSIKRTGTKKAINKWAIQKK